MDENCPISQIRPGDKANILYCIMLNSFNQFSSTAGVNLSFSQFEYTVSETDSTFLVQLNKNKPLANPLEVGVAALTLEEADLLGYLPLNNSLKQAGIVRLILRLSSYLCMHIELEVTGIHSTRAKTFCYDNIIIILYAVLSWAVCHLYVQKDWGIQTFDSEIIL